MSKVDADKRYPHSDLVDVFSRRRVLLLLPLGILLAQIKTALSADAVAVGSHQESERAVADRSFFGLYRKTQSHYLGIARFTVDAGESGLLMSDYTSGVVRRLSQVANAEFTMGSSFTGASPVELILRFRKDENGNTVGVSLQPPSAHETFAERVPLVEEQISFQDGPAKLAGTLLLPQGKRPNAAIILLHGSGALTRDSFGPYPYFFASLGLAVLIYDKRGTGASTGARLDGTIGPPLQPSAAFYPDDLVSDALAALKFMRTRKEINPEAIGLWGSSEGGMLATQVAAQSTHVAFVINSSGSVAPVWQTLLYQVQAVMKARGNSASEIERALDYTRLWIGVARTGKQFEVYLKRRQEILDDKEPGLFWSSLKFTTADEMRWDWDHILSFDPLPALLERLDVQFSGYLASSTNRRMLLARRIVWVKPWPKAEIITSLPRFSKMPVTPYWRYPPAAGWRRIYLKPLDRGSLKLRLSNRLRASLFQKKLPRPFWVFALLANTQFCARITFRRLHHPLTTTQRRRTPAGRP